MAYRVIQVGAGGWGGMWCSTFLPPNVQDGLIEVVAAVDTNPAVLENARRHLGLTEAQCYTDARRAMDEIPADFCTVVVPPAHHEAIVDAALAHDLHILSEKPIADTLDAAIRIARNVERTGKKMGVTMSHRFARDKTSLRRELRSGRYGALDYLVMRYCCNYRRRGAWGRFRHEMADPLMVEGAVHHLDILADLAGAPCSTLYAQTWNPAWGQFAGDSQGMVVMHFANGVRAFYEGADTNAAAISPWENEYLRAECEKATLVMAGQRIECLDYDPLDQNAYRPEGSGRNVPLLEQAKWSNTWLIEQFVQWLDGGPAMETDVAANLRSVALVFAAIESSRTGRAVSVPDLLETGFERVRASH